MKKKMALLLSMVMLMSGCASWRLPYTTTMGDPKNAQTYGYHPIDPLPVEIDNWGDSGLTNERILNSLPDETMRLAIGELQGNGGITFGPAQAGYEGNSYVVVLDYIKFNTNPLGVQLTPDETTRTTKANLTRTNEADVIVPTFIGVGLRLTANVTVNEGRVDLGNLFALGAAANARKVSGTIVVQTLGISGESVSTLIPMPSELNATTIQNAIMSLGAIKAKMYETDTRIIPRVVGVYNNMGGGQETINGFISSMLKIPQKLVVK